MTELLPEEIELAKKRRVVERLADRLVDREEAMTDLREELDPLHDGGRPVIRRTG